MHACQNDGGGNKNLPFIFKFSIVPHINNVKVKWTNEIKKGKKPLFFNV